jgi:hypothetical protein
MSSFNVRVAGKFSPSSKRCCLRIDSFSYFAKLSGCACFSVCILSECARLACVERQKVLMKLFLRIYKVTQGCLSGSTHIIIVFCNMCVTVFIVVKL